MDIAAIHTLFNTQLQGYICHKVNHHDDCHELAADSKLKVETIAVKLEDIADLWDLNVPDGQRLVINI